MGFVISPEQADIIFLRISKSKDDEITGLEAAKSLRKLCCHALLIFISANKQLAANTFPFPLLSISQISDSGTV